MASPERNARRRLQRVLDDEVYGPKLARLSAKDARSVLDAIDAGKPQAAVFKEIDRLDAVRKARKAAPKIAKASQAKTGRVTPYMVAQRARAIVPMDRPFSMKVVITRVEDLTDDERREYLTMGYGDLVQKILKGKDTRYWYHPDSSSDSPVKD